MNLSRVYISESLQVGKKIDLSTEAVRHLITVMRMRDGEQCVLFNGDGHDYVVRLEQVTKKHATAVVLSAVAVHTESPLHSHLGQAIGKGDRMDYSLQKAVELGVTAITPLITERVNVRLSDERLQKKMQHWQDVMVAACEQSGRAVLPTLHQPLSYTTWLQRVQTGLRVICDPYADANLSDLVPSDAITFAVGPEGGLTTDEVELAKKHAWHPIRLGTRVLRTETMSSVMLSIAQNLWGDL